MFIKENQGNDLFTAEIVRKRKLENGKEIENIFSEILQPDTGIVGALRRFLRRLKT